MSVVDQLQRVRRTTGEDRMVFGVCGGIARATGLDPVLVRVAAVLLAVGSGIGAVAYLVAAIAVPEDRAGDPSVATVEPPAAARQALGVGLVTIGILLLFRRAGFVLPDQLLWPAVVVSGGVAVAWSHVDGRRSDLLDAGQAVVARIVAGSLLLAVGVGIFAALHERLVVATQIVVAVLVTSGGVVLLAGPWIVRLGRQLSEERVRRIRADERAEVAAHLHDSVLQTLALIQRQADSPAETRALARRQERELRAWLYGEADTGHATLGSALRAMVDEIEAVHAITVEVVVVGDADVDGDVWALLAAIREAVVNAAKHSGSSSVSVFVEVDTDRHAIVAFVRDRGRGFDPGTVPDDRRGISDSIVARMARHGGHAEVTSSPGEGTEVGLAIGYHPATAGTGDGGVR